MSAQVVMNFEVSGGFSVPDKVGNEAFRVSLTSKPLWFSVSSRIMVGIQHMHVVKVMSSVIDY